MAYPYFNNYTDLHPTIPDDMDLGLEPMPMADFAEVQAFDALLDHWVATGLILPASSGGKNNFYFAPLRN